MTWHAKLKGAYSYTSQEGKDNILEMVSNWGGATVESQAAVCANSYHEGGLNPWRWQGDSQSSVPSGGYGLFQFTPGSGYLNSGWPGITPNLNVNEQTATATPEDGICQCDVLATDYLGKWVSNCWRSYWDMQTYNNLYAYRQEVLNRWGTGSSISMAQFWQCADVDAATFIFLACFEGPRVPNYDVRKQAAAYIYQFLTGSPPPTPPVPPTPPPGSGVPAWLLKKIADKNNPNYMI